MSKAWIVTVGLAVPLLLVAACSSSSWTVDPLTQTAGSAQSKDCATEAKKMERVALAMPNNHKINQPNALVYAQAAEQAAAAGNEQECWSRLEEATTIIE